MTYKILIFIFAVFVAVNLISAFAAAADKKRAIKGKRRISEKTLMLMGLFGGALGELITMKIVRHKTKHALFMIGLPFEIFLHIVIFALLISKLITERA